MIDHHSLFLLIVILLSIKMFGVSYEFFAFLYWRNGKWFSYVIIGEVGHAYVFYRQVCNFRLTCLWCITSNTRKKRCRISPPLLELSENDPINRTMYDPTRPNLTQNNTKLTTPNSHDFLLETWPNIQMDTFNHSLKKRLPCYEHVHNTSSMFFKVHHLYGMQTEERK